MEIPKFCLDDFLYSMKNMKQGGEACVFKGLHSNHGDVAIKKWHDALEVKNKVAMNKEIKNKKTENKEVELLMRNAYHQNIIQFLGILIDEESKCIGYVMPYMLSGSLHDVIHSKSQQYDQNQIKSWVTQICYGLAYLHSNKIIHRDIKPSNILLGKSHDDVKLSDFGVARSLEHITHTLTSKRGTVVYMAPEMLKEEEYDISVDVYSLSITIWEILQQRLPYDHITPQFDLAYKICKGERPELNNNLSKEVSDLLTSCWHTDASKRSTIHDVLEFFKNTGFAYTSFQNFFSEYVASFENSNDSNNNGNNESFSTKTTGEKVKRLKELFPAKNAEPICTQNKLNVAGLNASNTNESLVQIPLNRPNESSFYSNPIKESPEKQRILLLGGKDGSKRLNTLLLLENNGQNWKELNIKLPYKVCGHGAQFLNNNIYIFGGYGRGYYLNSTCKLSKTLKWEKMADMNKERYEISNSSVVLNNQIWVCGGSSYGINSLKSVEMYDPLTNKWKYMKRMNQRRWKAAAVVVKEKIFCFGRGWNGKTYSNLVECYDPSSDVWTAICNMPKAIVGHCAVEYNGNFIVMGGKNGSFFNPRCFNNVWTFNNTTKRAKWIDKPAMSISRSDFSIAKIDDEILVCGGWRADKNVEIFDGEVWRDGPTMPTARRKATCIIIPAGFAKEMQSNFLREGTIEENSSRCSL